nr:hypothetical protein [Brevundimonas denitrificans]
MLGVAPPLRRKAPAPRSQRHDGEGRPKAADAGQQVTTTIDQGAEAEGNAERRQGGGIGDQSGIERGDAEEGNPVRRQIQGDSQRRGQDHGRPRPDQAAGQAVHRPAPAPVPVQGREGRAQEQQDRVEDQQHPQEPQVGQGEGLDGERRRRRSLGHGSAVVDDRHPDQHGDDGRQCRPPEHRQRAGDAAQAVTDKAAYAPAPDHHVSEQARDQEEGGHAEQVDGEEQRPGGGRSLAVRHHPHGHGRISHGRVQHDAEQEGEAPEGV